MKELGMSIMLLFNTVGGSIDPKFSDEAPLVEAIKVEIREMQRKIQWIETTDEDFASKYVRIDKLSKDIIKKKLALLTEGEVYGQEGISKKIAELSVYRDRLVGERNELNKKIKSVDKEIAKWQIEISPNQTSMF